MALSIIVCGLGKTGSRIAELALQSPDFQVKAGVCADESKHAGTKFPLIKASGIAKIAKSAQVFVDFTNPEVATSNLVAAAKQGLDLVVGTTGFSPQQLLQIEAAVKENKVSAVIAPNFSVGVNVFFKYAEKLAGSLQDYDVEIIEAHHNQKKDAPSGTALKAAKLVAQAKGYFENQIIYGRQGLTGAREKEIAVHAVRAGSIVGDHEIIFAANNEVISLSHRALSRDCFASGALVACKWVAGRKDGKVHSMFEVLGL